MHSKLLLKLGNETGNGNGNETIFILPKTVDLYKIIGKEMQETYSSFGFLFLLSKSNRARAIEQEQSSKSN